MIDPLLLIDACNHCYACPMYVAGPDGRDAATVAKIDGQSVLIFRGTLTEGKAAWLDWLNDFRAELTCRRGFPGEVHAGFADSLDNLLMLLPVFDRGPAPIVTGHSKGASVALLMGWYLLERYGIRAKVVQFAPPGTGNADFAYAADAELDIDCYVNPHDIVPKLPLVGYKRAGHLIAPSQRWTPPHGFRENHSLDTGYRPWVEMDTQPPRRAA